MGNNLFPRDVDTSNTTSYVERLITTIEEVETGFTDNSSMAAAELERLRRLTFFRVSENTIWDWTRKAPQYHPPQYFALMNYWLAAWEQLYSGSGSNGWNRDEYYIRQSLLIELISAEWLTDTEKEAAGQLNYYDIRKDWQHKIYAETSYFDIAKDVYYNGGLQLSFDTFLGGVDFWHVFPVEVDGFNYEMFRQNTGRPIV